MEPQKMIGRLEDLIRDRQSFIQENCPENNKIYEDDIEALEEAIKEMEHFDNAKKVIEDNKRLIEEQQCRIGKLQAIVSDLVSYI